MTIVETEPPLEAEASRGPNVTPSYVIAVSVVGAVLCVILGAVLFFRYRSKKEDKKFDRLAKIGPSAEHIRAVQKILNQRAGNNVNAVPAHNRNSLHSSICAHASNKIAPAPSEKSVSSVALSSLHSDEMSSQYDSDDDSGSDSILSCDSLSDAEGSEHSDESAQH